MSEQVTPIRAEDKRRALDHLLQSDALARADQLKNFLKYVCEMEISGRAEEISEYSVGVEALGKHEGFSTAEDASVRNRAYALRQKLEKYYAEEAAEAPVRIEFIKGTYIPRFVEARPSAPPPVAPEAPPPVTPAPRFRVGIALGVAAGILLGAAATWFLTGPYRTETNPAANPVLREAWGPLLDPQGNVLICLGTAAQLTLLPYDIGTERQSAVGPLRPPKEVRDWYSRHHRFLDGNNLFMVPDVNSPHFGDILGATTAIRMLTAAHCPYKLLPERVVPVPTLSARNTILFGVPHKSEVISKLLQGGKFQFVYDPKGRDINLVRKASGSEPMAVYSSRRDESSDRVESFSLITVAPVNLGGNAVGRVVVFSGDPSAGAAAAAEYFSSPEHMAALKDKMRAEGHRQFPASYQVLLRCKLDSNLLVSFAYESHAVLR